jgi:hypothetical protein
VAAARPADGPGTVPVGPALPRFSRSTRDSRQGPGAARRRSRAGPGCPAVAARDDVHRWVRRRGPGERSPEDGRRGIAAPGRSRTHHGDHSQDLRCPQAVVLPLEPFAALEPVLSAARAATGVGSTTGHQDADPWTPHISVAYSNCSGPAAPVIAALGEHRPDLQVTISSLSLVAQVQVGRSWQWRDIANIRIGEPPVSPHRKLEDPSI